MSVTQHHRNEPIEGAADQQVPSSEGKTNILVGEVWPEEGDLSLLVAGKAGKYALPLKAIAQLLDQHLLQVMELRYRALNSERVAL